ncbi:MAG: hypothetical protein OXH09_20720 [Gammaproteobacteria bacterium]|nr:hypothetical protein [Gammaproteobacteria bacterium]
MAARIIVGLAVIAAIVQGLWPDLVPEAILPLVIVVLGLAYGVMCLDAEDATGYLALAIAVGAAAGADVLGHIHVIGDYLDAIVDQISVALFGGVVAVLAIRTWNRIMPSDGD